MKPTALADVRTRIERAPPTRSEPSGSRLPNSTRRANRIRSRLATPGDGPVAAAADGTTVVANAADAATEAEARAVGRTGASGPEPPDLDRWWLLVAPFAGAVVLSSVSVLVDPNPLRTGTSRSGLLGFAVLVPFFLLCMFGTLTLIRDATRLSDAGFEWSPDPRCYVIPSAAALTALHAYWVVGRLGPTEELVGFLVGSLVVTLVASSILAGPVYLFRRRHRFGTD